MPPLEKGISPGSMVWFNRRRLVVKALIDLESVLLGERDSAETIKASIHELQLGDAMPTNDEASRSINKPELLSIPERSLDVAKARLKAIGPLLGTRTKAMVQERAREVGVSVPTLYNWLRAYENSELLTALMRRERSDKGGSRLAEAVDQVIGALIEKRYLTAQKLSKTKLVQEIQDACRASGLGIPHAETILARLARIPEHERVKRREGKGRAQQLRVVEGSFPGADWPLAFVQIDHTPMDVEIVDDISRCPIGRPWITLAFDVFSRMVMGFYISLDPPSAMSVGMCLAQAMLPKNDLVSRAGCENAWPIWGKIGTLHADNAKEFRGKTLALACAEYGIDLQWRPVLQPHFGGHIERMMGTLGEALHSLPGTTFSNVREKGEYDSGKVAVLTLAELETWVTQLIVDVYHQRLHSALGMPPIKKFQEGILGDGAKIGRGLIPVPHDAQRIRLDFMPHIERSVQRNGVSVDGIAYYDPVLRPWVKARNPDDPAKARQLIFRRDPRDISRIYFYDPDLKEYYPIPYRDRTHPAISIWELRAAAKSARQEQKGMVDEAAIFRANQRLRRIEEQAGEKTRKARRAQQRRRLHGEAHTDAPAQGPAENVVATSDIDSPADLPNAAPFDDLAFGDDA